MHSFQKKSPQCLKKRTHLYENLRLSKNLLTTMDFLREIKIIETSNTRFSNWQTIIFQGRQRG